MIIGIEEIIEKWEGHWSAWIIYCNKFILKFHLLAQYKKHRLPTGIMSSLCS
jgi:hypothetical protein